MGAAASMKLIYSEAMHWFKQYFDEASYVEDYRALDKNGDGGISFEELQAWLKDKASDGSSWRLIVTNMSIFKFAHTMAGKHRTAGSAAMPDDRIVGLDAFKQFLVHLFVLSILWVHFKHADQWKEGQDCGNEKLNFNEFKMACRSFSSAQANEQLSEAKIAADFKLLDIDQSGYLDFFEVCTYCSNFVDADFAEKFMITSTPAMAHTSFQFPSEDEPMMNKKMARSREETSTRSADNGGESDKALDVIAKEMAKNENIAQFEEIKANTEILLGVF